MFSMFRRLAVFAAVLVAAPLALAGPAHADDVTTAAYCEPQTASQPFMRWLDPARYVLVPGGAFAQQTDPWTDAGAGIVTDDDEAFGVDGADGDGALDLPAGSSATSPSVCVDVYHPTMRFLARNTGSADGRLRVEVLFKDLSGQPRSLVIGRIAGDKAWAPGPVLSIWANLLTVLTGETMQVQFRFTPRGEGSSWRIDGIYLDPWGKD